jgi:dTDP-4-amino-4,6-dideoxygalactose transaminase
MNNNRKPGRIRDDFLVFGAPDIKDDEIYEVVDSMRSGWLGTGPKVAQFESDFACYKKVDTSHVAAVSSCTAALHLSMIAAGIGPGDEVITTPLTFCATVNAIIHSGATPVLADVDPETTNIDPDLLEAAITPRTRAILPVHFAGRPCDMDPIMDIANRNNLKVIEDCAHAIETEYKGRKTGTFGDFGCFSFYVTKNVVTGEGGMVIAREQADSDKIRTLALHGMTKDAWKRFSDSGFKHYQVIDCGYKYNMMDLQAAIGIHQLKRVEKNLIKRKKIWERYQNAFSEIENIATPPDPEPATKHACHLYTLLIDIAGNGGFRDTFVSNMTSQNIGVGIHYLSIPEHPYYREKFGWQPENYPNAMRTGRQIVSLPLSARLTDGDVEDVIEAARRSF